MPPLWDGTSQWNLHPRPTHHRPTIHEFRRHAPIHRTKEQHRRPRLALECDDFQGVHATIA